MKKKFGLFGEPLFLGVLIGIIIGCLACKDWNEVIDNIPTTLQIGIKMGAVMELIPRITSLFIEGLKPIAEATKELIAKKFGADKELYIGMSPALVIGHPTTLVVSLLLIPVTLILAVVLPGNQFLPLASLAGMFYVFVMVLPYTNGNVLRSFIVGLVVMAIGLYFVTWMSGDFTSAAHHVAQIHPDDKTVQVPAGFGAGALDFASSPLSTLIYACMKYLEYIGAAILSVLTIALVVWNRRRISK
jgi:PTS system galactitol-specific IIC component